MEVKPSGVDDEHFNNMIENMLSGEVKNPVCMFILNKKGAIHTEIYDPDYDFIFEHPQISMRTGVKYDEISANLKERVKKVSWNYGGNKGTGAYRGVHDDYKAAEKNYTQNPQGVYVQQKSLPEPAGSVEKKDTAANVTTLVKYGILPPLDRADLARLLDRINSSVHDTGATEAMKKLLRTLIGPTNWAWSLLLKLITNPASNDKSQLWVSTPLSQGEVFGLEDCVSRVTDHIICNPVDITSLTKAVEDTLMIYRRVHKVSAREYVTPPALEGDWGGYE